MGGVWPRRTVGVLGVIGLGVISNYAYAALQDSSLPLGNLVAILIWPIAMILVAAITIAVVTREPSDSLRPPEPTVIEPESEEVTAARARLADLEAQDLRVQRGHLRNQAEQARESASGLMAAPHPDVNAGWAAVQLWEQTVVRILADPKWGNDRDLPAFEKAADGTMLSDVAGRERLVRYVRIKDEVLRQALQNAQYR